MKRVRSTSKPEAVKRVRAFLGDSLNDYIAARVLFLSDMPKQGAILSSTAIEKACKAILALSGNTSRGHLKHAHWNALKNFNTTLYERLNPEFLALNRMAYELRYTDDLPQGFNLVIATREFLAELDRTVMNIIGGFMTSQDGESYMTSFQVLLANKDPRLLKENRVEAKQDVEEFVYGATQHVYEVRNDENFGLIEYSYTSVSRPRRVGFLRAGLVPKEPIGPDQSSYDLSHEAVDAPKG